MGGGEAEAFDVGGLAVDGAKLRERLADFGGGNGEASVFEHFQDGPSREVVTVAFYAPFVHIVA